MIKPLHTSRRLLPDVPRSRLPNFEGEPTCSSWARSIFEAPQLEHATLGDHAQVECSSVEGGFVVAGAPCLLRPCGDLLRVATTRNCQVEEYAVLFRL
jgi:hypothetical protein